MNRGTMGRDTPPRLFKAGSLRPQGIRGGGKILLQVTKRTVCQTPLPGGESLEERLLGKMQNGGAGTRVGCSGPKTATRPGAAASEPGWERTGCQEPSLDLFSHITTPRSLLRSVKSWVYPLLLLFGRVLSPTTHTHTFFPCQVTLSSGNHSLLVLYLGGGKHPSPPSISPTHWKAKQSGLRGEAGLPW